VPGNWSTLTSCPKSPALAGSRAFLEREEFPASIHWTEITTPAQKHYHKRLTEVYYVLECADEVRMELDGEETSVRPGIAIFIPPGVRHRALSAMRALIVVVPKFDPADEWFD